MSTQTTIFRNIFSCPLVPAFTIELWYSAEDQKGVVKSKLVTTKEYWDFLHTFPDQKPSSNVHRIGAFRLGILLQVKPHQYAEPSSDHVCLAEQWKTFPMHVRTEQVENCSQVHFEQLFRNSRTSTTTSLVCGTLQSWAPLSFHYPDVEQEEEYWKSLGCADLNSPVRVVKQERDGQLLTYPSLASFMLGSRFFDKDWRRTDLCPAIPLFVATLARTHKLNTALVLHKQEEEEKKSLFEHKVTKSNWFGEVASVAWFLVTVTHDEWSTLASKTNNKIRVYPELLFAELAKTVSHSKIPAHSLSFADFSKMLE